jgi:hypothetical protein
VHPRCVLPRLLAAVDMRNRHVRQSKFRGLYLRHIPSGPGDSPALSYHSRTFEATELLRADYWPTGALRSVTVYFTEIQHRYSDFVEGGAVQCANPAVHLLHDAPDDFVEVAQASHNFGISISVASLGMQPGFGPQRAMTNEASSAFTLLEDPPALDNVPLSRRAVIIRRQGFARHSAAQEQATESALSLLVETEAKIAALRKPGMDASLEIDHSTPLQFNSLYDVGPTPGIEVHFGRERVVAVPHAVHNACIQRRQQLGGLVHRNARPADMVALPPAVKAANSMLDASPAAEAEGAVGGRAWSTNPHEVFTHEMASHWSGHAESPGVGCTSRLRIGSRALNFTCTCSSVEYRCSVHALGAPFVTWVALHKDELKAAVSLALHSALAGCGDSGGCEVIEHNVIVPAEYTKQPSRTISSTDATTDRAGVSVLLAWKATEGDMKLTQSRHTDSAACSIVSAPPPLSPLPVISASTYLW